jgi:pyruvate/2-oxoglutarate dehydrogenase complex dihydrolipoamide acyltransferase (E2) component
MATSAAKLSEIINSLSKEFDFNPSDAFSILTEKSLLPKKLILSPSAPVNKVSPWASKKAQDFAEENNITPTETGSGRDGKWTLSDVKALMDKPIKTKVNASPHALKFALDSEFSLNGKTGSGADGKILLADVQKWIDEKDDNDN